MEEQSIGKNHPDNGNQETNQPKIKEEDKKIIHLANAPEKFGELIRDEIIQFFVEQKTQKPVEINQLILGIRDKVFDEEKIKNIILRNALKDKKVLEDYFYPLCITRIFTLIKDKKLEIAGDLREFLETYAAIKNNISRRVKKGVFFLRINKYFLEDMLNEKEKKLEREKKKEKVKEESKEEKKSSSEEFTNDEAERIIIEILKENERPMTKKELFLELHILSKNKLSQILYRMKQKGLIDYQPGDWQKSLINLISEELPQSETVISEDKEGENKEEEEIKGDLLKVVPEEQNDLGQQPEEQEISKEVRLDDPLQKAILEVFESSWGEESLNLNRLFTILKTWDHDGHIGLQRFSGANDSEFIKIVANIPGIRIDEEENIIYNREKE